MNLHSSSDAGDFGRILNPHLPEHRSGGSSAAAVAAGYLDIAFGADQGGSIRIPSSWCGVLGLMPTFGLVPHTGCVGPDDPSLDYVGPMARTVEDLAAALESVAGADGFDWRQAKVPPSITRIYSEPGEGSWQFGPSGFCSEGFGSEGSDPEVDRTVLDALAILGGAGARLENVSIPVHLKAGLACVPLHYLGGKRFLILTWAGPFSWITITRPPCHCGGWLQAKPRAAATSSREAQPGGRSLSGAPRPRAALRQSPEHEAHHCRAVQPGVSQLT